MEGSIHGRAGNAGNNDYVILSFATDYGSNYEFVRHVLMMDSTFPGNHGMWRAVNSSLVHTVFYIATRLSKLPRTRDFVRWLP